MIIPICQEVCRKKQGSHDYAETEWLPNEAEAREAFRHITAAHHQGEDAFAATAKRQLDRSSKALHEGRASIHTGSCRMNLSNSTALGRTVRSSALHSCEDIKQSANEAFALLLFCTHMHH